MKTRTIEKYLPELIEVEALLQKYGRCIDRVDQLATVSHGDHKFPIYSFCFGTQKPEAPTFLLAGGVHGLERIGSRVITAFLNTFLSYIEWDETLHHLLRQVRFCVVPIVNPAGMYLGRRSNANGVDLMRNSPVVAQGTKPPFLLGGHHISSKLPWYSGIAGQSMEVESQALVDAVKKYLGRSKVAIALDVHSGFGVIDRLWFPYAKTKEPFHHIKEMYALNQLLDRTLPNHIYKIEPQSLVYTTHGDLWDHMYDQFRAANSQGVFLPLTLELGSWMWVKKNPRQLFSALGMFNPIIPHRQKRILRRHLLLIEFLLKSAAFYGTWSDFKHTDTAEISKQAVDRWYQKAA